MIDFLAQAWIVFLLVFGFGFVVFFHELGHFLAAKWAGVRVEQFAVGFGQALLAWRKGLGFSFGTSRKVFEQRILDHMNSPAGGSHALAKFEDITPRQLDQAIAQTGLGETEYRLNWIPLGGYVKMVGQDDLNPNAVSNDPRAYNQKTIGQRMVIVSAGVIMNIILAAIGFMIVFLMGFNSPPAVVGGIQPNSPAQEAGMQVGDQVLYYGDAWQHDFKSLGLNSALSEEGKGVPVVVRRKLADGSVTEMYLPNPVIPRRADNNDPASFLALGVLPPVQLQLSDKLQIKPGALDPKRLAPASLIMMPGDKIVAINGTPVNDPRHDYHLLDEALQRSAGKNVQLTIEDKSGKRREAELEPVFAMPFGGSPIAFGGMTPRARVSAIASEESSAMGKLLPGDRVIRVSNGQDTVLHPSTSKLTAVLGNAGSNGRKVDMTIDRPGVDQPVEITGLEPNIRLEPGRLGLGIQLDLDPTPVIGDVLLDSPARQAGIEPGSVITSINGQAVDSWHAIRRELVKAQPNQPINIGLSAGTDTQPSKNTVSLTLNERDIASIANLRYTHSGLALSELSEERQTNNPAKAIAWGVIETRDLILQFYITLQRMVQGSVSYKNLMGPIGIFHSGTIIANRGTDWLIWFLAMISANLAVVNFLPIPIVDGGLFLFLILEKIKGKPLSPKAQVAAQYIGLALILGVFLLVTYQDILRLI